MSRDAFLFFIGLPGHQAELKAETAGSKAAQLSRVARLGLNEPPDI